MYTEVMFSLRVRASCRYSFGISAAASQVNVSKCQVMICIAGYDPEKIWHAPFVIGQKKGKWLGREEVRIDEEKKGKGEDPNLSSSHDQQIAQIAGGSLSVPTPSNA